MPDVLPTSHGRLARLIKSMLTGGLCVALCGFMIRPWTPEERTLIERPTNKDPAWRLLQGVHLKQDKSSGITVATYPPTAKALDGKIFRISGYVLPIGESLRTRHLIIAKLDPSCFSCSDQPPDEAVEVFLKTDMLAAPGEFAVSGKLELIAGYAGLRYRLANAVPVALPHGHWLMS